MAKLYYKFRAMKCGKTRDLIKTWYNYDEKGFNIIIIKPGDDKKAGQNVQSRAHEELKADYVVPSDVNLYDLISRHMIDYNLHAILVDEAQFLAPHQVDELADVVDNFNIPVMCYGLRADFVSNLNSVLVVEIPDEPGGLDKLINIFADAEVNIEYMYAVSGHKSTKSACMIFRVADTKAAEARLVAKGLKILTQDDVMKI